MPGCKRGQIPGITAGCSTQGSDDDALSSGQELQFSGCEMADLRAVSYFIKDSELHLSLFNLSAEAAVVGGRLESSCKLNFKLNKTNFSSSSFTTGHGDRKSSNIATASVGVDDCVQVDIEQMKECTALFVTRRKLN